MPNIGTIDPKTASLWLEEDEAIMIDVREPSEYEEESIEETYHIPLGQISCDKICALPHEGKKIIMQCRSGGRSMKACEEIYAEDESLELYNLEGGILAWKAEGLPTQKGS